MRLLHLPSGQYIRFWAENIYEHEFTEIIEEASRAEEFLQTHTKKELINNILLAFSGENGYPEVKKLNGLDPGAYLEVEFEVIDTNGEQMSHEVMSVSYTELDNGMPAICLCSDFIIPITTKGLAKSFIGFCDKDLRFNLNNLSNSLIKFKAVSDDEELLEIYYKNMFIGYIAILDMYNVFIQCYNALINIPYEN